jgi:biotin operon repressor
MGRGRPKASGPEAQAIMDRRMKVLALRREGHTLAAVAAALETTISRVTTDVKWLREQGYDLGEGHTGRALPPPGAALTQLRAVAAADDEAVVRREVNDRRIRGEDILSIAIAMQIIPQEVRRHIHNAARIAQEGSVQVRRALELARLDRMLHALDEGIRFGDPKAVNAARSIVAERCKILGLYMPVQVEHTFITLDMIDAEMKRLNAELARAEHPELVSYIEAEPVD